MRILPVVAWPAWRTGALGLAVLTGMSGPAAASPAALTEIPIEELLTLQVYSASKFIQDLSEAPSTVSVITAADIRAFGWRTLSDILGSVRGLYTSYDRNYSYLGARGFLRPGDYNSRFLLLVDGHRINDAVYDQATVGTDFILDVDLIDRVEFVHGPGSSLHGPNALFGVIHVFTRNGRTMNGPQAVVEAGSAGQRKLRASYGMRTEEGADLLVSATQYRAQGRDLYFAEFDTPATNHGVAIGLDHDRADSVFVKGALRGVSLAVAHSERKKGIPTASFQQAFNDPRAHTVDAQSYVDLGLRTPLDPATDVVARLYWGRYRYDGDYVYGPPPLTVNRDLSRANWVGTELRATSTALAGHKLVAGFDYQRDYRRDQMNHDVEPEVTHLDSRRDGYRWGLYLQDELHLAPALLLNAGLRYDRHDSGGGHIHPRLGLIYQASTATTWKAVYATAFRAPNAYEMFYDLRTAGGQKSNPDLGPERVRSTELIVEHHAGPGTRLSASLFRNQVKDLISQRLDPDDGLLLFENLDRVRAHGATVELEKAWRGGARLRSSVSVQRAEDAGTGATLINSPRAIGKLALSAPVLEGAWRIGIETHYLSHRHTLAGVVPSYWLSHLTVSSIRLAPGVDAGLSVYNLFDRRYADPGSAAHAQDTIMQDRRSLRLRLRLAF